MVLNHELIFLIFFKDAGLQSSISFIRKHEPCSWDKKDQEGIFTGKTMVIKKGTRTGTFTLQFSFYQPNLLFPVVAEAKLNNPNCLTKILCRLFICPKIKPVYLLDGKIFKHTF